MRAATVLAAALAATQPTAAQAPPSAQPLVLTNTNMIDGLGSPVRRNATLVIRAGRIDSVRSASWPLPKGARVLNLKGAWLLPGLIDAHVHLRELDSARRALRSGVTTARSMGVDSFIDVRTAELHRRGAADLPDIVASGYHVRRRLSEAFFADFPGLSALATGVAGEEKVRLAVRANASKGARVIKVMATERAGTPGTDLSRRMLDDAELQAAVAEAKRIGFATAAHAHTDDGARAAVVAGVRTVEHGTMVNGETLRLMRRRGVCLVPTLSFWADMAGPGGEYDHPLLAERARLLRPRARNTTAAAHSAGVSVAAGSDMRYDATSPFTVADEVAELVRSGLSPAEAVRSATSVAARCIGVSRRTGAIRPGLEADLIAVGGNPLLGAEALKDIRLVINDGAIVVDRLAQ